MFTKWHYIECCAYDESGDIHASARVPLDSPWFDGHFPGQPILPGIAMMAMAFNILEEKEEKNGKRLRLKGIKRVRFKKAIRPDDRFELLIKSDNKQAGRLYNFIFLLGGDVACTGIISVEKLT